MLRAWNHTLRVEPAGEQRCRYSDTVEIDAGPLTAIIAALAVWIFRYRQRRWHKLVRNHLLPGEPAIRPIHDKNRPDTTSPLRTRQYLGGRR